MIGQRQPIKIIHLMIRARRDENDVDAPPTKIQVVAEQDGGEKEIDNQLSTEPNLFPDVWSSERSRGQSRVGLELISGYLADIIPNKLVKIKRITVEYENHPSVNEPRHMTLNWPAPFDVENYYSEKMEVLTREHEECHRNLYDAREIGIGCTMTRYGLKWADARNKIREGIDCARNKRDYRQLQIAQLNQFYLESMARFKWSFGATFKADEVDFDEDLDDDDN